MNNFFTKKKILIFSLLILIIIVIVIGIFIFLNFYYKKEEKKNYTEHSSYLNNFSISTNDILEFKKLEGNQDYELALNSEKYNSFIYISSFDSSNIRSIDTVINSDKSDFCSKFENISEISEITSDNSNEYTFYEYHFSTQDKFIQVYYLLIDNKVYVFDFYIDISGNYEYNLKDYTKEIVSSFKILVNTKEENK